MIAAHPHYEGKKVPFIPQWGMKERLIAESFALAIQGAGTVRHWKTRVVRSVHQLSGVLHRRS